MQPLSKVIGDNVQRFRKSQGLTQPELGKRCKPVIGQSRLSQIENGEKLITVKTIGQLAKGLGVPPFELLVSHDAKAVELREITQLIDRLPKGERASLLNVISAVLKTNGLID